MHTLIILLNTFVVILLIYISEIKYVKGKKRRCYFEKTPKHRNNKILYLKQKNYYFLLSGNSLKRESIFNIKKNNGKYLLNKVSRLSKYEKGNGASIFYTRRKRDILGGNSRHFYFFNKKRNFNIFQKKKDHDEDSLKDNIEETEKAKEKKESTETEEINKTKNSEDAKKEQNVDDIKKGKEEEADKNKQFTIPSNLEERLNFYENLRKKEIMNDIKLKVLGKKLNQFEPKKETRECAEEDDIYSKDIEGEYDDGEDEDEDYEKEDDEEEEEEEEEENKDKEVYGEMKENIEDTKIDFSSFDKDTLLKKFFDNYKTDDSNDNTDISDQKEQNNVALKDINKINNILNSRKKGGTPLILPSNQNLSQPSNNKYFEKICNTPPNELINNFFETAPERVKDAVKITVFNIIGNIQKYAVETSFLISYEKLFNFFLQIVLTGYMIKNAEYRLTVDECLYGEGAETKEYEEDDVLKFQNNFHKIYEDTQHGTTCETETKELDDMRNSLDDVPDERSTATTNKEGQKEYKQELNKEEAENDNEQQIKKEKEKKENEKELEKELEKEKAEEKEYEKESKAESNDISNIDEKNYITFLQKKIDNLESEIKMLKQNKKYVEDDLFSYIKSLSEIQLRSLTENMSVLVLDATKKIVELVVRGMTFNVSKNIPNEFIYLTGSILTYLCFWQLLVGYNLREMEIKDELSDYLNGN